VASSAGATSAGCSILWSTDEPLLAGLALVATAAVGSAYIFAAPVYLCLVAAWTSGEPETARNEQMRSVNVDARLASCGYLGAAKVAKGMLGIPLGPAHLPHSGPGPAQTDRMRGDLEAMGFFD
jgi:N-acetylneuraminate lyase